MSTSYEVLRGPEHFLPPAAASMGIRLPDPGQAHIHGKIEREDEMEINHLPYMNWVEWMNNLSQFKYAVHLMPTHAAGTFALNCAYHGIPCIGYNNVDTQRLCHPKLSVDVGDIETARKLAYKLKNDDKFYKECSQMTIRKYKECFDEEVYIYTMKKTLFIILLFPLLGFSQQTINGTIMHDNILRSYILLIAHINAHLYPRYRNC